VSEGKKQLGFMNNVYDPNNYTCTKNINFWAILELG